MNRLILDEIRVLFFVDFQPHRFVVGEQNLPLRKKRTLVVDCEVFQRNVLRAFDDDRDDSPDENKLAAVALYDDVFSVAYIKEDRFKAVVVVRYVRVLLKQICLLYDIGRFRYAYCNTVAVAVVRQNCTDSLLKRHAAV